MFGYYLDMAIRSLRRNKVLTGLMVLIFLRAWRSAGTDRNGRP